MSEQSQTINKKSNNEKEVSLREMIGVLVDNKWKVIVTTTLFFIISISYALLATPIYSGSALIQVEQNTGDSMLSKISDMLPMAGGKPASQTEIGLLKSRMVLGQTVDDLSLDTVIEEKYFPLLGKGLSRLEGKKKSNIAISRLVLPEDLLDKVFTLSIISPSTYEVRIGNDVITGKLGKLLIKDDINLLVSGIDAAVGTTFNVVKQSKLTAINELGKKFTVVEQNKDSGLLLLTYKDESIKHATQVLNSISNNYLQQNVSRKSEEAAKSLEFLKEQLPVIRGRLDEAENRLNMYRQQNESVDLSLEAKSLLDSTVSLETQLNELTFKEAEISKLYTKDHPAYRTLLEKKSVLQKEKDKLNVRIGNMPKTQQEILSLTRDVQSGQEVYMLLLNKQQELSINKASTVGNVRIIDNALADTKPVAPNKILIVVIGLISGLLISTGYILLLKFLHNGLESSEDIESLGMNVYASVPVSNWLKDKNVLLRNKRKIIRSTTFLAKENPSDLAVEALRSLRTSLHFAMIQAKNNIILISGATPEAGKTFVSSNLGAVIAQAGKKVLLIDADMRKGQMHYVLNCNDRVGLSSVLSKQVEFTDAVQDTSIEGLDFMSRGQIPPNPSELLMSEDLNVLLIWASKHYDLVIVDTPPILAVSDACITAKYAGTIMLVARFHTNTLKEIEVAARRFEKNDLVINGVIFNGVEKRAANYYEYGAYKYYS
ncbi:polysaccharide biosynthesis tyrosine autokinase [Buttiauxella sp. A111]|uniref:polysaccharide biosynthesis tyrosine autokinase n=1 Tax=Buttiauxella sp. A111 TaxID=2563088 RepID=UPI0010E0C5D3|nr:polysaccharide biosynthesis tyrosine autokinase [Buttiauxella sp. A111]GDX07040.1 tyrosine-protein kinase Wzc [Buttiauxella sp. A111]